MTFSRLPIVIEPADPQVVYVPEYDPWVIYGDPLAYYPGWIGVPDFHYDGPGIWFGLGVGIGLYGGFGWGWHSWGTDWHRHGLIYGDHPYVPHSREYWLAPSYKEPHPLTHCAVI